MRGLMQMTCSTSAILQIVGNHRLGEGLPLLVK